MRRLAVQLLGKGCLGVVQAFHQGLENQSSGTAVSWGGSSPTYTHPACHVGALAQAKSMHLIPAVTPWRRHGPAPSADRETETQGSGLAHVHAFNPRRDPMEKARPCPLHRRENADSGLRARPRPCT